VLERARSQITQPGEYLCFEESDEARTVALTREWTRIGRSLAADVRFDDPTVSRRHALIVRQPAGVRVLDDRSLNGVFVNGERVDGRLLQDGDEIVVGRYRLTYLAVSP
jgi:pSer/pThr/pTyr-binding forkhead associated (FHA) protein